MIKVLHEEILNSIYLYSFQNDTSEEKKSLNGHCNQP